MNTFQKSEEFDAWLVGLKDQVGKAQIALRLDRAAYSTHIRPPSPRTFGHLVHGDPATDSMSIRPPIPR